MPCIEMIIALNFFHAGTMEILTKNFKVVSFNYLDRLGFLCIGNFLIKV